MATATPKLSPQQQFTATWPHTANDLLTVAIRATNTAGLSVSSVLADASLASVAEFLEYNAKYACPICLDTICLQAVRWLPIPAHEAYAFLNEAGERVQHAYGARLAEILNTATT